MSITHGSVKPELVRIGRSLSLQIEAPLLRKLWGYTVACDFEISGIGEAEVDEERGRIVVCEPFHLLEQEGTSGSTHLDQAAVSKLVTAYARDGKSAKRLRFWYHSHCDMATFWSQTDMGNIAGLHKFTPWQISAVFVRKGEVLWRVTDPNEDATEWEQLIALPKPTVAELAILKTEISAKVRKATWYSSFSSWRKGGRTQSRWKSTKHEHADRHEDRGSYFGF